MKKLYEKPFITRHHGGIINKFGEPPRTQIYDSIDGIKVSELIGRFGSPLFVYSEKKIKEQYRRLLDAFTLRYPKVQHSWSYKTNYLKAVCKTFHNLGSWAEVVSDMEYEMAKKLGIEPAKIIFNGPFKPYHILKTALTEGAMVNIDGMDELYDAEKIAHETGNPVNIGIRLNMSLGTYTAWDRFGFNIDSGEAYRAVKRAVSGGKICLTGLHCHVGTFMLDPDIYRMAVKRLIEFSKLIKDEFDITIKYIDIGGGFASRNKLKGAYLPTDEITPAFDSYAEAVADELLSAIKPGELPLLILETGRALIDECASLIASVCAVKRLPSGMRAVIIDAGVNLLFTSFWYNHNILPAVDRGYVTEDHVVYGPLCMQIDVIHPQIKLPHLEKGDAVIIGPVGAYNNTQWLQFIQLRPNVVMIGENGDISVIREAETLEYLQEKERVPEWMG
ncbi:MAG: diaminopimelate decarboxylase [Deltaproteobacteria bacterium]|nr:diaminopimelate decarboxylase [Deltaproteobacteria bacterium]